MTRAERIVAHLEAVKLHKELASGYEKVNAWAQERRELIRAAYHQNEAIILQNADIAEGLSSRHREWVSEC
jgi:hypothetical protein